MYFFYHYYCYGYAAFLRLFSIFIYGVALGLGLLVCCTARKAIFSFSKCSEKIVIPKKLNWNMIFLVSSGKMIFIFPQNVILFFRPKMKDDPSQKNTWKYDIFSKFSEKMVSPKKLHWNTIFLYHKERRHFFFPKI